jgi:thiamine kinase-like enzyme
VLAAVHAAFWDDRTLADNDTFRAVVTTTPGLYQTVGRKRCLPLAQDRWAGWIGAAETALLHDALDQFPADVALVNEPRTLIHGDPRSDNILYRDDGQVVLLDWALAGYANPAFDVGYLLSSCLGPERLESRPALTERYHAALTANGVSPDAEVLRQGVEATYRTLAVQILMSIAVLRGEGYGDDTMDDLWMPRILAGLAADW